MQDSQSFNNALHTFLKHPVKKTLLISATLPHKLENQLLYQIKLAGLTPIYINFSIHDMAGTLVKQNNLDEFTVFVFDNIILDNHYMKHRLDQWPVKAIMICDKSLLHPTLDPSVYFAPIENHKIKKECFSKILIHASNFKHHPQEKETPSNPPNNSQKQPRSRDHFLNKKLLTKDTALMEMLANRVVASTSFKAFLFDLVLASRNNTNMQIAAANAITVLNYAHIPFSGMDLSNIRIARSVLDEAILDRANFTHADLSDVSLHRSFLKGTNFTNALLHKSDIGELPHIPFTGWTIKQFGVDPSGDKLIIFGENGESYVLNLWNKHSGKLIKELVCEYIPKDNGPYLVCAISFQPDRQSFTIFVGSDIYLHDINTLALRHRLSSHANRVTSITYLLTPNYLASGDAKGNIYIWDLTTFSVIRKLSEHQRKILSITSNKKFLFAAGEDFKIYVWHTDDFTLFCKLEEEISSIVIIQIGDSRDLLAVANRNGTIVIFDYQSQTLLHRLQSHQESVTSLLFYDDDRKLISAGWDKTIRVWELNYGQELYVLSSCEGMIEAVQAVPNCAEIVLSERSSRHLKFYATNENNKIIKKMFQHPIASVAFNPQGDLIFCYSEDGSIALIRTEDGTVIQRFQYYDRAHPANVAINSSFQLMSVSGKSNSNVINLWNLRLNKLEHELTSTIRSMKVSHFSPDDKFLASGGDDTDIKIWCLKTHTLLFNLTGHSSTICAIKFSADSLRLATASWDGCIKLWDLTTRTLMFSGDIHTNGVIAFAFDPLSSKLAAGGTDGLISLWDIDSGNLINSIPDLMEVHCLAYSPDGTLLLSSGTDQAITIRNTINNSIECIITGHLGGVWSFAMNDQGKIVSGGEDNTLKIWQLIRTENKLDALLLWSSDALLYIERIIDGDSNSFSTQVQLVFTQRAKDAEKKYQSIHPDDKHQTNIGFSYDNYKTIRFFKENSTRTLAPTNITQNTNMLISTPLSIHTSYS